MLNIVQEKGLIYDIFKYDVILCGTSTYNALGNGFQHEIKINFPKVNEKNMETPYADPKKLGKILTVDDRNVTFCLCYINSGRFRPDLKKDYLNYDALEKCLKQVNELFVDKKVATTVIGGSKFDGDGDHDKILTIVKNCCPDIDLTIYDYIQESAAEKHHKGWQNVVNSIGKVSKDEYYRIKNKFLWEDKHGIWNPRSISGSKS